MYGLSISGRFRFGTETMYQLSAEVHTIKKKLLEIAGLNLNNNYVEINSLKANVTFSFDFPQMVHYPNISDQVGCLYFKVPWKCSLFGVGNKGLGTQVMYLINEIVECEKGSNAVISYIRPWHDARAIARARAITRANQEKGSLGGR